MLFSVGNTVSDMGHSIFTQTFLDDRDHGGFLYIKPTFQCLHKLLLPSPPYLFAILLQKWEMPWAKVFPIRLLLRLGAEYRCKKFKMGQCNIALDHQFLLCKCLYDLMEISTATFNKIHILHVQYCVKYTLCCTQL